jgi:hypothetical protein
MIYGIDYTTRTLSGRNMAPAAPEPLECQSCGANVSELLPCEWDSRLMVGACCLVAEDDSADVPPACPVVRHIMDAALTAGEMCDLLKAHRGVQCAHCESVQDAVELLAA